MLFCDCRFWRCWRAQRSGVILVLQPTVHAHRSKHWNIPVWCACVSRTGTSTKKVTHTHTQHTHRKHTHTHTHTHTGWGWISTSLSNLCWEVVGRVGVQRRSSWRSHRPVFIFISSIYIYSCYQIKKIVCFVRHDLTYFTRFTFVTNEVVEMSIPTNPGSLVVKKMSVRGA